MRYMSDDQAARVQGLAEVGELYEGLDGQLYEWVEGIDRWGNAVGFWHGLAQPEAPPLGGLGALYEAPDGTLYRIQGLAEEEEPGAESEQGGEAGAPKGMGPGRPGEVRAGPDGRRYRWVQGRNAQGQRTGFWRRLRPRGAGQPGPQARRPQGPGARRGPPRKGGFLRKLLPVAKLASQLIPIPGAGAAVSAGLTMASKLGRRRGVAGYDGLGALYAAPDGTVYALQGMLEDDMDGLYGDPELQGYVADPELQGYVADPELQGYVADPELQGFAADPELQGYVADPELEGLEQGYVREGGVEGYLPSEPARTRWFAAPAEPPEIWKPLW